MSTQAAVTRLTCKYGVSGSARARHLGLFIVLLMCALAVVVFGSPYFEVFPTNRNVTYQLSLSLLFLVGAVSLRRIEHLTKFSWIAFALLTASFVILVTLLVGGWIQPILHWLGLSVSTSQGIAIAKLYEALMIVIPIIVLTKLSGADLGSIYLKRGNLRWGLSIGALVFFNFAASAFLFFALRFSSFDALGAALVWGLVFSFANGFMEELWLRGLFLRHLKPILGVGGSVLLTAIAFALFHGGATYLTPAAIPFIVANTFTLGLACGYLIIKTDSIWGATLIHAASDLFLFIAMLAST